MVDGSRGLTHEMVPESLGENIWHGIEVDGEFARFGKVINY